MSQFAGVGPVRPRPTSLKKAPGPSKFAWPKALCRVGITEVENVVLLQNLSLSSECAAAISLIWRIYFTFNHRIKVQFFHRINECKVLNLSKALCLIFA